MFHVEISHRKIAIIGSTMYIILFILELGRCNLDLGDISRRKKLLFNFIMFCPFKANYIFISCLRTVLMTGCSLLSVYISQRFSLSCSMNYCEFCCQTKPHDLLNFLCLWRVCLILLNTPILEWNSHLAQPNMMYGCLDDLFSFF